MLKEYMNRTNKEGEKLKLDELCSQLNKTTTIEEVDQIHELLTSFTLLDLSNSDT
ncbi:predicted protein [Nematostella vectensis]|uniref:Uncharacterized protein n=2 Tax=Nematostella vectensis TaxID=45351 RepID=A7RXE7_NEMVE|nr:predicted protein [Nematostella vectensis]|eukprot:XP_001635895.1 predicted protein [Nematostella vectensis]